MTVNEKEISTTVQRWLTEKHCSSSDKIEGENAQRKEIVGFAEPQPSEFLFASQEAQNILKSLTRKNVEEEQDNKNSIGNKSERSDCHKSTRAKQRWKRIQKDLREDQESVAPRRSLLLHHRNGAGGNNKSRPKTASSTERSGDRQRRLIPSPPKSAPPRRMSLSLSRYPILPTPRITSPTGSPPNSRLESINNLDVESTVKFSLSSPPSATCAGNLHLARLLSRRRFSLPDSHRVHITDSFHPRNSSLLPHRCSSAGPSGASTRSTSPRRWGSLLTTKMQMNREKLEKLIEERSKVIANLPVSESDEHTSSSAHKDKECDTVAEKRASRRPSLTSLSVPPSAESDVTCLVKMQVHDTSIPSHADAASSEASISTNIATTSKSRDSKLTSYSRDRSPGRLDGGAATDSRTCRSDSVLIRSFNNCSVQGTSLSIKRDYDKGLSKKSGSYIRRRSVPTPAGETRQASKSKEGMKMIRDDDEIKKDIEEELQRLVQLRKKELMIQAAPGSSRRESVVTRLEARAKCKTTNAQLRKIMNNFNMERTTAQLLSMNQEILNVIRFKPVRPI